ncbi:hypothetical protein KKE03_03725 [Patescibacteria group bacterium]|nr:hypothetical protein [Patescibacteria group bacterium]
MNKRTIIFGLITAILFLIVLLSALYFKPSKQEETTPPPIPIFNPTTTPSTYQPPQPGQLSITNINPPENTAIKYYPNDQVTITFGEEVEPEDFFYTVSPDVKTATKIKIGATLSLYPDVAWIEGITTITILGETKSINGNLLGKNIIYKLNTGIPDNIDLREH